MELDALEITGLCKKYKNNIALTNLNLKITYGTFFGLLGPNGAGKSSIINIIAGITKKDKGIIKLFGKIITHSDYEYKHVSGFQFEKEYLLTKLTAYEYLEFAGIMYGLNKREAKKRCSELIEYFDLPKEKKYIENYSAGMRKKLAFATAIIHRPKILFLDEPLENIDPITSKTILDFLNDFVKSGNTVLMSSHQIETIEKQCDEIAIIEKGKNILNKKVSDLKDEALNSNGSLTDLYIKTVSNNSEKKKLSWY